MIKGILFDKDGTLIDFFSLWLQAAKEVIDQFIKENNLPDNRAMKNCIMNAMGIIENRVDPKGGLAYKPYTEIAKDVHAALREEQIELDSNTISKQIEPMFNACISGNHVKYTEMANVKKLIQELKRREIYVGLATADTIYSAQKCLESLDVLFQFDYVGADDGIKQPKPEACMFREFQEKFHLNTEEIAVVGDTYNDIVFAKSNGGIAIGVLSGVSRKEDFNGEADFILDSIRELPELLDRI